MRMKTWSLKLTIASAMWLIISSCSTSLCLDSAADSQSVLLENHTTISVDQNSPNNNSDCWKKHLTIPLICRTLSLALEGVQVLSNGTEHPWIVIQPGNYTLDQNSSSSFTKPVEDFGMVGSASGLVLVHCSKNAGLKLSGIDKITLTNITFVNCGAAQDTTSLRNQSLPLLQSHYWKFRVSLYFLLCKDINLDQVNIEDSDGIGIYVYSSGGTNTFESISITNSRARNETYPAGGGLYIEFSYCVPGNCIGAKDGEDNGATVTNSVYSIKNSKFVNNIANATSKRLQEENAFILPNGIHHTTLGRGGGVSIIFKGQSRSNKVDIESCDFVGNRAIWAGGLFLEHQDNSTMNNITVSSCNFTSNEVLKDEKLGTGGGGARAGFLFYGFNKGINNRIKFENCSFRNNEAYWGGGMAYYGSRELEALNATNSISFGDCSWSNNFAQRGAAMDITVWYPIGEGVTAAVEFYGATNFHSNSYGEKISGLLAGVGSLSISSVPTYFKGHVEFYNNSRTALAVISAPVYFLDNCVANFTENRGRKGGAISLHNSAIIQVHEMVQLIFQGNTAEFNGGAIYSTSEAIHQTISSRNCFIRYSNLVTQPNNWNVSFHFQDNTAGGGKNAIHGTSTLPCIWGKTYGHALSYESEAFCWNNWIYRWNGTNSNCSDQVTTDPGVYSTDSHEEIELKVFPGIKQQLPTSLDMFDDVGHAVEDVIFITGTKKSSVASVAGDSRYISDSSLEVMGVPGSTLQVDLYTLGSRAVYSRLNVTLLDCPTGFGIPDEGDQNQKKCQCLAEQFRGYIKCNSSGSSVELSYPGVWAGVLDDREEFVAGNTPYMSSFDRISSKISPTLNVNTSLVGDRLCSYFNRTDVICGKCIDGYGPTINSDYQCIPCNASDVIYKWVFYILTELFPPTILFGFIVFFNLNLTSAAANGFIFFSQVFVPIFTIHRNRWYMENIGKFYSASYDIWNLNFFKSYHSLHIQICKPFMSYLWTILWLCTHSCLSAYSMPWLHCTTKGLGVCSGAVDLFTVVWQGSADLGN